MRKLSTIIKGDRTIWGIFIFFSIVSILAVYTSIGFTARHDFGNSPLSATLRHVMFVGIGYLCVWLGGHIGYKGIVKFGRYGFYAALILLIVVLTVYHGRRMRLPLIGSFQPSEWAKVCLILYLALKLPNWKEQMSDRGLMIRAIIPIGVTCLLIFPENLSTAIITFTVSIIMLFVVGIKKGEILKLLALLFVVAGLFVVINLLIDKPLFRTETWISRTEKWLNPDPTIYNQENMSKMAVARGGLIGAGIGNTIHGRLMTQAHNDFIYAVIVEETGSIAGVIILLAYSLLYLRCIVIARKSNKMFGKLTALGIGTLIYIQALVHICVSVGVLPVTGQTLPFISYGGSAYIFMCAGLGAVQCVAKNVKKEKTSNAENKIEQPSSQKSIATT